MTRYYVSEAAMKAEIYGVFAVMGVIFALCAITYYVSKLADWLDERKEAKRLKAKEERYERLKKKGWEP